VTRTTVLSRGGLVAVLLLLAFAFQGTRGIWEPDEGRYTAVALNMLESGDWLLPTVDGEHPHLTKPPLTYWALAGSFAAFGRNEWAARLPGALAFLGTGWLLFALGRRLCPAQPALPALVWALSPGPLIGANVVSTDALLVFFETAAMVAFVEAWYRDGATRGRWILAMWLGWGLAFMTKGPPALLPLVAMLGFLAVHDRARLRGLFAPAGLVVFAAVGLTWFALIVRQEPGRLGYFLGYEVYDRIFTGTHARNAHWYDAFGVYLPVLLVGALPWWPLALAAAGGPRRALAAVRACLRARDREWLLLAWWLLLPLAVFFLARSRLHLYVLPVFVPLALVLARILAGWTWLHPGRQRMVVAAALLALVGLKGAVAYWPADRDARAMAAEIDRVVGLHGIEEIAFVDMRGFHGLQLYLGVNVETVRTGAVPPLAPSRFVAGEDLCAEIAEHEDNAYAVKETRASSFVASVAGCASARVRRIGHFDGDGNRIVLFAVETVAGSAGP
jgi:4-amino-4-deoxy-L-arabinose transferase-like glycosyltransferase